MYELGSSIAGLEYGERYSFYFDIANSPHENVLLNAECRYSNVTSMKKLLKRLLKVEVDYVYAEDRCKPCRLGEK